MSFLPKSVSNMKGKIVKDFSSFFFPSLFFCQKKWRENIKGKNVFITFLPYESSSLKGACAKYYIKIRIHYNLEVLWEQRKHWRTNKEKQERLRALVKELWNRNLLDLHGNLYPHDFAIHHNIGGPSQIYFFC